MKKTIGLIFLFYSSILSAQNEYDLQKAINASTTGKVFLPGGIVTLTKPVVIPSNLILEGNGTILMNTTNDYALKVLGNEGSKTLLTQDIDPGGGIPNINPTVTVKNAAFFQPGDYVKLVREDTFPLRIEFNIIKSINGNAITFKKRFLQPFFKADQIKMVQFLPNENVVIKNLEITSAPLADAYGLYAKNTKFLSIENVTFKNITRKALHIENSYMPEITNNQFIENGSPGKGDYGIGSVLNMGITITNNKLFMSGAIYLKGNLAALVSDNQSESPGMTGGDGISIVSTFYSLFQSNVFTVANCYGIWMNHGSEYNIISNNQFLSGITSGIYVTQNAQNNLISANILHKNNGNGIFVDFGADNNIINNNVLTNNNGRGILIHGSRNIIKNNTSQNNLLENIRIAGVGNVLSDNIVN